MAKKKTDPIHPGEIQLEEFFEPMKTCQYQLSKDISVPARPGGGRIAQSQNECAK